MRAADNHGQGLDPICTAEQGYRSSAQGTGAGVQSAWSQIALDREASPALD
jgi:hypothetical protein